MLAKRREDRFESAEALSARLAEVDLPQLWDQGRAARWWARTEVPVVVDATYTADPAGHRLARKLS